MAMMATWERYNCNVRPWKQALTFCAENVGAEMAVTFFERRYGVDDPLRVCCDIHLLLARLVHSTNRRGILVHPESYY